MSKGLEALKRIRPYSDSTIDADLEIIETELNDYEETKKDLEQVMSCYQDLGNCVDKQIRSFEIIKEKNVDVINLKSCFKFYYGNDEAGLEDYNKTKNKKSDSLTKEEYGLLKEVLK